MTIGISITNRRDAIVITDARESRFGRYSDRCIKTTALSNQLCHGVIYGSGDGEKLDGISKDLNFLNENTPAEIMRILREQFIDRQRKSELNDKPEVMHVLKIQADLIEDPNKKSKFLDDKISQMHKDMEQGLKKVLFDTKIRSVFYDKKAGRIVKYGFTRNSLQEIFDNPSQIGSGGDGARTYFEMKLQGLDMLKLSLPQLVFYGLNAFTYATMDNGVGGAPTITRIDENKAVTFNYDVAISLANVSAHYIAETISGVQARKMTGDLLEGNYADSARKLKISVDRLMSVYVPYSEVQASVNRKSQK